MKPQPAPPKPHSEIETVRLIWLAIFISVFSFLYYNRLGDLLLYGDAVAHINIARRTFDSRTPGILQLGTVWLPLPHLLILPFILSKQMWQSGTGGSVPSMAGFVFGVLGIFRLVRAVLPPGGQEGGKSDLAMLVAPWLAAILYAANPNLIYMQSIAMGESLYLAFFIWAVVYLAEFVRRGSSASRALIKCGLCLAAACWTRYDGWFLAGVLTIAAAVALFRFKTRDNEGPTSEKAAPWPLFAKFVLIAFSAPALWLAYNAAVYRNPLEFANGPYSAKAIEQKTATLNPAKGNLWAASSYFLKATELNLGESNWQQRLWLLLALVGSLAAAFRRRGRIALLLWTPLPFYAFSIAYGSIPIFVPTWWPFSVYNVRYGLQLLPAFVVFAPQGISVILHSSVVQSAAKVARPATDWRRWTAIATVASVLALGAVSDPAIWRAGPICYREAQVNSRGRFVLDAQVAGWIKSLPPDSTLLVYLAEHVGALEQAGIPLRRTINEGNRRAWRQPVDPEGLWDRALADPSAYADYAIGFEGDPVWKSARDRHLLALVEIHTTGQPSAAIFQTRMPTRR
jgi:hypothetical protein